MFTTSGSCALRCSRSRGGDRMVAENLVYRCGDPRDGRRVLVRITERGATEHRRLLAQLQRDDVFAGIGAELVQLTDLLNLMLDHLRETS